MQPSKHRPHVRGLDDGMMLKNPRGSKDYRRAGIFMPIFGSRRAGKGVILNAYHP